MRTKKLLAFVLLLPLAACARSTNSGFSNGTADNVVVRVRNDAFWDATIYLVRSSSERVRLGIANSYSTTNLKVPRAVLSGLDEVRFQVSYIGRTGHDTSDSILAQPGDTIELQLRE